MIYLDYNATTSLCPPALEAMRPFLERYYGNPSSIHAAGREARAAVDDARDRLAGLLGAKPHELIFTSSGTESNNLAVLGLARRHADRGRHLICGSTEHHAVLHAFEYLAKRENFEVTFLRVDQRGLVDLDELKRAIRNDTTLVSIMTANNETGVIQPMREISKICRARGALLHSDMVQSFGKIAIECHDGDKEPVVPPPAQRGLRPGGSEVEGSRDDTLKLTQRDPSLRAVCHSGQEATSLRSAQEDRVFLALVDAASFAAHKFYGPKGAGLLYLRAGLPIDPVQFGGAHENQRRPGTENVPAIVGMAVAAESVLRDRAKEQERQRGLRDRLWEHVADAFPAATRNGDETHCLANTLNVSFAGLSSETILMALDVEGVCASSGSACMVGSVVASHVLLAMGLPRALATSAVRFSLGHHTTEEEIDRAGQIVAKVMKRLSSTKSNAMSEAYAVSYR